MSEDRKWGKDFPYGNSHVPADIQCDSCASNGWGPMIYDHLWYKVEPKVKKPKYRKFLCQVCMESKLGRKLTARDLKTVAMNRHHELLVKQK